MLQRYGKYVIIGIFIAAFSAVMLPRQGDGTESVPRDMQEILASGILRVTTEYGSNSYYIDSLGNIGGYHYRLIRKFADDHGLKIEVVPEMDIRKQDSLLHTGACDLIANGRLLTSPAPDTTLCHTIPVAVDRLVIVQRKAEEADSLCPHLQNQLDLAGKTVCIPANPAFRQRILHFAEEIGDSIHVEEIPHYGTEQLLALVAHGDRCYAICEEEILKANIAQYPQLDDRLAISFNQFYSWTVSHRQPVLLDSLNTWLERQGFNYR